MNLQDLSKDALVEVARLALGRVGDSARTPKPEYIRMLSEHIDQDAIAQAVAKVTANGVPMRAFANRAPSDPLAQLEQLRTALSALGIGATMDEDRVRELITDASGNLLYMAEQRAAQLVAAATKDMAPRVEKHIISSGRSIVIDEHTHPAFGETLDAVAAGLNVLLVGPAGCGKSHLAAQVAKALGREFGTLHCSAGASESQLLGWLLPIQAGGAFEYVASQFATLYEAGRSVFLLDEIDAADPNMLMVINGALANGHLHVPMRHQAPVIERGADCSIVAAANTFGTGADMLYVGRNTLDAATLDRFYVIPMDYDARLEDQIAEAHAQPDLLTWVRSVRAKVAELRLRRVISTRTLQKGCAMLAAGRYDFTHVRGRLLSGWTADERAKLGSLA